MSHPIAGSDVSVASMNGLMPDGIDQFVLLREMHHRVANSYTFLSAMLRREFVLSTRRDNRKSFELCEARIVALGDLHRFLAVGAETRRISIQHHIEQLCQSLGAAFLAPLGIRCEVFVDDGLYSSEHCELLALVITELVTNAAKHAFRRRDDALIRIDFTRDGPSWACVVSDNGVGSVAMSPGIGSRVLQPLLRALNATLARKSNRIGTSVAIIGDLLDQQTGGDHET
jgi:two-component sensor histidine kinase